MTKPGEPTILSSGISGLDLILHGGFPADHPYLVTGEPGTGKTSLVLQFLSQGVNEGESAIYVSFSESLIELRRVADSHGWPLDKIEVAEMARDLSERSAAGSSIFHSAEVELPNAIAKIIDLIERVKPTRLAIDSLTELHNMAESDRAYRRALFELKAALEERHVTALFIEGRGSITKMPVESLVHGVIDLHMKTPLYGPVHRSLEIKKLRGRAYETGVHDFTIVKGGLEVYPRIRPRQIHRQIGRGEPVRSGVEALDELVGGGIDRGANSLLLGPSGTGKSTIVIHFAMAAAERGEYAVIYAFDEDAETVVRRAEAMELPLAPYLDSGHIRIQAINVVELSPGHFAHLVREDVVHRRVTFVAIDSLNGYLHAMPGESALVPHLHDLLTYLGAQGVTIMMTMTLTGLLTTHPKKVAHLSYLADTILLLRYIEEVDTIHKSIVAVKHRTRDHNKRVRRLTLGRGGVHIGEPLSVSTVTGGEQLSDEDDHSRFDEEGEQ